MKKSPIIFSLFTLLSIVSCSPSLSKLSFAQSEYSIRSGEKISTEQNDKNINYEIVGDNSYGITLDPKTGVFTFADDIPNYLQVMVIAKTDSLQSEPVVVTLIHDYKTSSIEFTNLTDYVTSGETIIAKSSLSYSITYSLKEEVPGISIDSSSGKVSLAPSVKNDQEFTVVASTHGDVKAEKKFFAITANFATVENNRQAVEKNGNINATYILDFSSCPEVEKDGVINLTNSRNVVIDKEYYKYNKETRRLTISSKYLSSLPKGENMLKIITKRNAISVQVEVATKFIYSAEDLQSINQNEESLSGYYILMNDIDLSSYLGENGALYNQGKGWIPIGQYQDVTDPNVATQFAFKGTFDGNGHVVSNLMMKNKRDTYAFNAGLFGYVASSATIKNLGVEGKLDVASYSGGFVGSNSGIIENCWSDVAIEVYSGENAYRYVGGFAGNNFGTIRNCYSLNNVKCDTSFGAFIGSNEGSVISCFARKQKDVDSFVGYGSVEDSSILFENEEQMKDFDYESVFPAEYWNFEENHLPSLKSSLKQYEITKFQINPEILKNEYYIGDKIQLGVNIYPKNYQDEYQDKVVYSIEKNGGAKIENGVLNTLNASKNEIVLTATIEVDGTSYEDKIVIPLGKRIRSLELDGLQEVYTAGKSYVLQTKLNPLDATEKVVYHLLGTNLEGISISGNVLTLDDDVQAESFKIYASNQANTIRTETVEVKVKTIKRIDSCAVYIDGNSSFSFNIPDNAKITSIKYEENDIAFTQEVGVIKVDKKNFEDSKDQAINLIMSDIDNNLYLGTGYYLSHEKFTLDKIKAQENEVIELASKEDFYKYFNLKSSDNYTEKYKNYDKTYVLTSDIDFEGDQIYGIGFTKEGDTSYPFSGKIYGLNHTIKNYVIKGNEYALVDDNSDSKNYGVGLFSSLTGQIYDIEVINATVAGKNFVGGLVGMMTGSAIVENCHVKNEKYSITGANNYVYTVGEIRVGGVIGRQFEGRVLACTYNGKEKNSIG